MSNSTVLEIVKGYLEKNGFDGLYNSDLNPCRDIKDDCTAGYQVEASKAPFGTEYDYYICETKENKE